MNGEPIALYGISPAAATPSSIRNRLAFVLPEFTRYAWTNERAQLVWEQRLARIVEAWLAVEWLSTARGVRDCWLGWLAPAVLKTLIPRWEAAQISAIQLQTEDSHFGGSAGSLPASVSGLVCIAVGVPGKTEQLRHAWIASDHDAIGALLGYPPCCQKFFRSVWVDQRCLDTTWAMAENTPASRANRAIRIDLPDRTSPLANILWRWLGVRAVPHLPCRFDCRASIKLGERLLALAGEAGYAEEADWIREILAWPVEWSALHGIAEVKSPLMKLTTRTDATADKEVVQWGGTRYPEEGPVGLHFPYQRPKKLMLTDSREFQRGLAHGAEAAHSEAWRYADNGFTSARAMEELHRPIVELARAALASDKGIVLDLGCGNGVLLSKICEDRDDLIPHGIDRNGIAIEHARQLLPACPDNFVRGDFFDVELWVKGSQKHSLILVMLGRLAEASSERAARLLDRLRFSSARVLAYVYPGSGELASIAQQFGLELESSDHITAAFLKKPPKISDNSWLGNSTEGAVQSQ